MLEAASSSAETVRIVCDDTIVFVLLVYRTWRKKIGKNIQIENWDDTVLAIRATMDKLDESVASCPACTPCPTVPPSPTRTARVRSPL